MEENQIQWVTYQSKGRWDLWVVWFDSQDRV